MVRLPDDPGGTLARHGEMEMRWEMGVLSWEYKVPIYRDGNAGVTQTIRAVCHRQFVT